MSKSALVTGASHGMGRALAIFLARRGYKVVCVARKGKELGATVSRIVGEGHNAVALPADLANASEVKQLLTALKKVTDLSFVAHLASPQVDPELEATLANTPFDRINDYVNVTLGAAITITKGVQKVLAKNAPSHLFFISSDWALRGAHGPAVFASVKAGIAHFARSIRREMARNGIRTTIILPGDIATFDEDWQKPIWDIDDKPEKVIKSLGQKRILLADILSIIAAALDQKTGRIEEVIVAPSDSDYDY